MTKQKTNLNMKNILLILLIPIFLFATNYYVSNAGLDAADGLTPATSWKTIGKADNGPYVDGDSILLNSGDIWYNSAFVMPSTGIADYITIGKYGTGELPILSCGINYTTSAYKWTASGSGTNEFYCELVAGGDPSVSAPDEIWVDDIIRLSGTIGALDKYFCGYGDNDGLGYSTIYIRSPNGDPIADGLIIVSEKQNYALSFTARNYIRISGVHLKHSNNTAIRCVTSGSNWIIENCKITNCRQVLGATVLTDAVIKSNIIKNITNVSGNGMNMGSSSARNKIVMNEFENIQSFCIYHTGSDTLEVLGNTFVGLRLYAVYNTTSGVIQFKNNIVAGAGYHATGVVVIRNGATGDFYYSNNLLLPSPWNKSLLGQNCTDSGDNVYRSPMFVQSRHKGYAVARKDDYRQNLIIAKPFAYELNQYDNGSLMYALSSTDIVLSNDWDSLIWLNDNKNMFVSCHGRGHVALTVLDAFNIQYTGAGSACALDIVVDYGARTGTFTATCTGAPEDDLFFDFTVGDWSYLGESSVPTVGILDSIDSHPNYSADVLSILNAGAKTFCVKPVTSQDIKTAQYTHRFDSLNYWNEEITLSRIDIVDSMGFQSDIYTYPGGLYDDEVINVAVAAGFKGGASTSATSAFLTSDFAVFVMSNIGFGSITPTTEDSMATQVDAIGEALAFMGAKMSFLTHKTTTISNEEMGWFGKYFEEGVYNCRLARSDSALFEIIDSGYDADGDGKRYIWEQSRVSDYNIRNGSPAIGIGDLEAYTGIPNLYNLTGDQITDNSGTVVASSVGAGAYGNEPASGNARPFFFFKLW